MLWATAGSHMYLQNISFRVVPLGRNILLPMFVPLLEGFQELDFLITLSVFSLPFHCLPQHSQIIVLSEHSAVMETRKSCVVTILGNMADALKLSYYA
jgi:hypothetical protein